VIVCVGIPSHEGKVCAQTVDSLLAEQLLGFSQGVHILPIWELGTALIGVARNKLAKRFLDIKEAASIVFVDSDISWKGGDLIRLARRDEDVVGGTYRAKIEREQWHVFGKPEPQGDLFKVDGLPGGFLKVSRRAFETIDAKPYQDNAGNLWRDYFPTGFHDGRMYGEDYGFCRLWRETGGSVLLDPSIKLRHHGGQQVFTGDPLKWLKESGHVEDPR
jgi:hypothetical protein